jgi:uncharacterized protein (DUF1684 family)
MLARVCYLNYLHRVPARSDSLEETGARRINGGKATLHFAEGVEMANDKAISSLEANREDSKLVGDATDGHETYGAGGFLEPDPPKKDQVIPTSTRLTTPVCAYNHEYLCPVAPKETTSPCQSERESGSTLAATPERPEPKPQLILKT